MRQSMISVPQLSLLETQLPLEGDNQAPFPPAVCIHSAFTSAEVCHVPPAWSCSEHWEPDWATGSSRGRLPQGPLLSGGCWFPFLCKLRYRSSHESVRVETAKAEAVLFSSCFIS